MLPPDTMSPRWVLVHCLPVNPHPGSLLDGVRPIRAVETTEKITSRLCAGALRKDSCQGDSGGPLVVCGGMSAPWSVLFPGDIAVPSLDILESMLVSAVPFRGWKTSSVDAGTASRLFVDGVLRNLNLTAT